MKTLVIVAGYDHKRYKINMETGCINGYSGWIFQGLSHVKRSEFIPRSMITEELVEKMFSAHVLFYQNGKCQYHVRDLDHGTTRVWGNRPIRIYFEDENENNI